MAFHMLILWVTGLTEGALLVLVIFLDLLLFVGLLKTNLQLSNPPKRLSMWLLLATAPKSYGLCTP
jgi:hypothetical protein